MHEYIRQWHFVSCGVGRLVVGVVLALVGPVAMAADNLLAQPLLCSDDPPIALSQDFDSSVPGQSVRSADEFVVPEGEIWELDEVSVQGSFQGADIGEVDGVTVLIYSDDRGAPGSQLCRFEQLAPLGGPDDPNFVLPLGNNGFCPALSGGTYWLTVIYSTRVPADSSSRRWYWSQSTANTSAGDGIQWHFRDSDELDPVSIEQPNGTTSCRDWQPAEVCFPNDTPRVDLCFGLGGDSPVRLVEPLLDQFASEDTRFLMATASNFSDPDGDVLTFSITGLPPSLTFNPLNGRISGTVDVGTAAGSPYNVTVTVTDEDGNQASDSFLLLVADDEIAEFRFERLWPVLQQSWYFGNEPPPIGVAAARLYVANQQFSQIQTFTFDGFLVATHQIEGPPQMPGSIGKPIAVAGDEAGFIYAIGQDDWRVHKLDSAGNQVVQFGGVASPFLSQPLFVSATNRGCGRQRGCVLVAESDRVHRFASDGQYIATFGNCLITAPSCDNGTVRTVGGLVATDQGLVFITDVVENQVVVVAQTANATLGSPPAFIGEFGEGQLDGPGDIAVDAFGNVFVVDRSGVLAFQSDGTFQDAFPSPISVGGTTQNAVFLELLGDGVGFLSNDLAQISRVRLVGNLAQPEDADLAFALPFASSGDEDGFFRDPADIAVGFTGNVFVTDPLNHRIQKFDPDGNFTLAWGQQGTAPGQFENLIDVGVGTVDGVSLQVITLDSYPDGGGGQDVFRVQIFSGRGDFLGSWEVPAVLGEVLDMAVGRQGFIYMVLAAGNPLGSAAKFSPFGEVIALWEPEGFGNFLLLDLAPNGLLYFVKDALGGIEIFTRDGTFVQDLVTSVDPDGVTRVDFLDPSSIAVAEDGKIVIGEFPSPGFIQNGLKFFRQDGVLLDEIGEFGYYPGSFAAPTGMDFGPDGRLYVSDRDNDRIQVLNPVDPLENAKAVIVAGGGPYAGNNLWDATQALTNSAYLTLLYQGFDRDEIMYLSPDTEVDLDGNSLFDDVDRVANNYNIRQALTAWATDADNVVVYFADHGDDETFRTSGLSLPPPDPFDPSEVVRPETLDSVTLDGWLDTLQGTGSQPDVFFFYEACEAGSFIDNLAFSDPVIKRVVIASAAEGQNAQFVSNGTLSFSNQFWTAIFDGDDLKDAFLAASGFVTATFQDQTPQVDTDGNGVPNESGELDALVDVIVGVGTNNQTGAPTIQSVTLPFTIMEGNSGDIEAFGVTDPNGISRVYAIIQPPEYQPIESNNPILDFPMLEMEQQGPSWGGSYGNFSIEGVYVVDVYAQDRFGNTSQPQSTTVTVGNPKNRRAVIVVGGNSTDNDWPSWSANGDFAYQALINQGYLDDPLLVEDIRYLSDGGTPGVDSGNGKSVVVQTLMTWAVDNTQDVTLYVIGPTVPGGFRLSANEIVTQQELGVLLNSVQSQIDGTLTVVIESNGSGSVLPNLAPNPAFTNDRIVVTSTSPGEQTALLAGGSVSFSQFFWNRVSNGDSVLDAFSEGATAIAYSTAAQTPLLDDDGDGIGSDPEDGTVAGSYAIGTGVVQAGNDPVIGEVNEQIILTGGNQTATITVDDVTSTGTVVAVRGIVTKPAPDSSVLEFPFDPPAVKGTGQGTWTGTCANCFGPFSGEYTVAVYAQDDRGGVSFQQQTSVIQTVGPDAYEADGNPNIGTWTYVDDAEAQSHTLHVPGDLDFIRFWADKGQTYQIDVSEVTPTLAYTIDLFCLDDGDYCTETNFPGFAMGSFRRIGDPVEVLAGQDGLITFPGGMQPVIDTDAKELVLYASVKATVPTTLGGYDIKVFRPAAPDLGTLQATITNALTSAPIAAAFFNSSGNMSTFSDGNGQAQIADSPGSYTADVTVSGFQPATAVPFSLSESQTTYLSVELTPDAGPPVVSTGSATAITRSCATLDGLVTANGADASPTFAYGTDPMPSNWTDATAAVPDPVPGPDPQTIVTATIGDCDPVPLEPALTCATTYYYRAEASSSNGSDQGSVQSFQTLDCVDPPTVSNPTNSPPTDTSTILQATVDSPGEPTQVDFRYRPLGGVYTAWDRALDAPGGLMNQDVTYPLAGLDCESNYEFQARATNPGGTNATGDTSFTTAACPQSPPRVTTLSAQSVGETAATLQGDIDPLGDSTTAEYRFREAGTAWGGWLPSSQGPLSTPDIVKDVLASLNCGLQHEFMYRGTNAGGTTVGNIQVFTTSDCPGSFPAVTTGVADMQTQSGASLNGTVNANGDDTTVTFDYGKTAVYDQNVTLPEPVTGTSSTPVSAQLVGLDCGTEYHFRVQGTNTAGTSFGDDNTFATNPCDRILLVDDDDNDPDVAQGFSDALTALGFASDTWNTGNSDSEPTVIDLDGYDTVIWFTGDNDGAFTGPGGATETDLAAFLDGGGCLVVSSQDYYLVRGTAGPTSLMSGYLGIDSATPTTVTDITGQPPDFGGLPPYTLDFGTPGLQAAADALTLNTAATEAFSWDAATAGAQVRSTRYNSLYLGFPFVSVPGAVEQGVLMSAMLDFCRDQETIHRDGFEE